MANRKKLILSIIGSLIYGLIINLIIGKILGIYEVSVYSIALFIEILIFIPRVALHLPLGILVYKLWKKNVDKEIFSTLFFFLFLFFITTFLIFKTTLFEFIIAALIVDAIFLIYFIFMLKRQNLINFNLGIYLVILLFTCCYFATCTSPPFSDNGNFDKVAHIENLDTDRPVIVNISFSYSFDIHPDNLNIKNVDKALKEHRKMAKKFYTEHNRKMINKFGLNKFRNYNIHISSYSPDIIIRFATLDDYIKHKQHIYFLAGYDEISSISVNSLPQNSIYADY